LQLPSCPPQALRTGRQSSAGGNCYKSSRANQRMGWIKWVFTLFAYLVLAFFINAAASAFSKMLPPSLEVSLCFGAATFLGPIALLWLMKKYIFANMEG
jgi:uncharacterized membrane-anchored protein